MTDHVFGGLSYGHFGTSLYNPDTKEWTHGRNVPSNLSLIPLGTAKVAIPSPILKRPLREEKQRSRVFGGRVQHLTREDPTTCPVPSRLLSEFERTSDAVTTATSVHDPAKGHLIAFGQAGDVDNKRRGKTVSVAALAGGPCGEVLRLVEVARVRRGWDDDKSIWLNVPELNVEETALWSGWDSPIQQICFANAAEEAATYLAVRSLRGTIIFRPQYCRKPSSGAPMRKGFHSAQSRINPNPVASVQWNISSGSPHADVAFNPWYQSQFAVIDQNGKWSVWDILDRRNAFTNRVVQSSNGSLPASEATEVEDGWCRVTWARDVKTLVACSRRCLAIFATNGAPQSRVVELGFARTADWILDLGRSTIREDIVFVLTTSALLLLQVAALADGNIKGDDAHGNTKVVFSLRHHRDPQDTSLHISLLEETDGTTVLLHSKFNSHISAFRISLSTEGMPFPASRTDIAEFEIPIEASLPTAQSNLNISRLLFTSLPYEEFLQYRKQDGPGVRYQDLGLRFFHLTIQFGDLALSDVICYSAPPKSNKLEHEEGLAIQIPSWGRRDTRTISAALVSDDFIAPEGSGLAEAEAEADGVERVDGPPQYPRPNSDTHKVVRGLRAIVADRVYMHAIPDNPAIRDTKLETLRDMVQQRLRSQQASDVPVFETLHERFGSILQISDVNADSKDLTELLQLPDSEDADGPATLQVDLRQSILGPVSGTPASPVPTISSLYKDAIETWLATLPPEVAGRNRLAKERLIRNIIADLIMASTSISSRDLNLIELPEDNAAPVTHMQPVSSSQKGKEPMLPASLRRTFSGISLDGPLSIHGDFGPSSLPFSALPTPSATPSLASQPSFSSMAASADSSPLDRLRKYVTIDEEVDTSLTRGVQRTLSHWVPSADPLTYNWRTQTQHIAAQDSAAETADLSRSERKRLQRRARDLLRRQQREAERAAMAASSSQAPQVVSSQMPRPMIRDLPIRRGWGSSPGPGIGTGMGAPPVVVSSQYPASRGETPGQVQGMLPSTQAERGRFGGRGIERGVERERKRRKKMPGFR